MKRLAILGSRAFPDLTLVGHFIGRLQTTTVVCSGCAAGPDSHAVELAKFRGLKTETFPADWRRGRSAGYARTVDLLKTVDGALFFWDGVSKGTRFAIDCAVRAGIWCRVVIMEDAKANARMVDPAVVAL